MSNTETEVDLDNQPTRAKWYGFPNVGDTFAGDFIKAGERQARDYDTDEPQFWDDGNPVMENVLTFQTALKESDDDDGRRTLYCERHKSLWKVCAAAVKDAHLRWADRPHLIIKRLPDGEPTTLKNGKKGKPPKLYVAKASPSKFAVQVPKDDVDPFGD